MKKKIVITESQLKYIVLYESKEEQEKQEFKKPVFKGISDLNYSSKENKLYVTIDVKNPSRLNLKIKDYDLDILIDNSLVGNTKMEGKTIVLKKGGEITSMTIPVELNVGSKMVIDMVKNYVTNSKSTHTIKVEGTLKGGIFIFSKKIKISESMSFKIGDLNGLDKLYNLLSKDAKKTIDVAKKEVEDLYDKGKKEYNKLKNKYNIKFNF